MKATCVDLSPYDAEAVNSRACKAFREEYFLASVGLPYDYSVTTPPSEIPVPKAATAALYRAISYTTTVGSVAVAFFPGGVIASVALSGVAAEFSTLAQNEKSKGCAEAATAVGVTDLSASFIIGRFTSANPYANAASTVVNLLAGNFVGDRC